MKKSGNPALNADVFNTGNFSSERMTINGTVNKTGLLLMLCFVSACWVWGRFTAGGIEAVIVPVMIGTIGGLILAIVTIFAKKWAMVTAPVYALFEGVAIGGVSAMFEQKYPGIVIQAVGLTFGTLACLLVAYRSGLIRATENFKLGVTAATGAIALLYLASFVLSFFDIRMGFIHDGGWAGILFSLFVVTIAALNLVMDFDFIEGGVKSGAPQYMEWYAAFGLLVTLVWLYLEILRLLAKSRK